MIASPFIFPVQVNGHRINVATWGDDADPPVVLIHGLRDHCRSWDSIATALSAGFRIVAPDLRGHGDSDWAGPDGYAMSSYAADIADVAAALGLERYAIVGHSLGGAIGLRIAAMWPDRVVAFAGIECIELPIQREEAKAPTPYPVRMRHWVERRSIAMQRDGRYYATVADASARMHQEQPEISPADIAHLARHALALEAGKGWRWKFDPMVRFRAPDDQRGADLDEVLDAISCPVMLAYGDASWVPVPAEKRLRRLKNHIISHYPGASHWLHHQFQARFTLEVQTFLHQNLRTLYNA